ncbi:MAG TPA: DUF255 domain-containing protein [Gammaproteobacteria bacterium]|nr:DUF255 domain-containing protein [Gammaproteobacteria bacterium]
MILNLHRRNINHISYALAYSGMIMGLFLLQIQHSHAQEWSYMEHSRINWRAYNKNAFLEARKKNRPVFILIFANWCHWCRKLETETLEKENIRKLLETKFIPIAVDHTKQNKLATQLGAKLVPTSIIITHDGKKLLKFFGFITADALEKALNKTLASWKRGEVPEEEFGNKSTCCLIPEHSNKP